MSVNPSNIIAILQQKFPATIATEVNDKETELAHQLSTIIDEAILEDFGKEQLFLEENCRDEGEHVDWEDESEDEVESPEEHEPSHSPEESPGWEFFDLIGFTSKSFPSSKKLILIFCAVASEEAQVGTDHAAN